MSGLFAILNNTVFTRSYIKQQLGQLVEPSTVVVKNLMPKVIVAYQDNTETTTCQITINDVYLYCDGEIYNSVELFNLMGIEATTTSTCEIIIHLYAKYGIEYTLKVIDGVFSFILVDFRLSQVCSRIYVARDQFGVKPLYILRPIEIMKNINSYENVENIFAFAKNLKTLNYFDLENPNEHHDKYMIKQFTPGCYSVFEFPTHILASWNLIQEDIRYHTLSTYPNILYNDDDDENIQVAYIHDLQECLIDAIEKRCISTDKPIICLLSGGLNSSLIAALLNEHCKRNNLAQLETYSIGIQGSSSLINAKLVAEYLGTNHTEITLNQVFLMQSILKEAIPSVIYKIESYDPVLVEEGIYKWILSNYIKERGGTGREGYVFCGEGLNELTGSHLIMDTLQTQLDYDHECDQLLGNIHYSSLDMTVKSMDTHGLNLQFPFLDSKFVQSYLSIPLNMRFLYHQNQDKYLLRLAFSTRYYSNMEDNDLIPEYILFGKCGNKDEIKGDGEKGDGEKGEKEVVRSMSSIIHEYIIHNEDKDYFYGAANTKEENLYRSYYNRFFC